MKRFTYTIALLIGFTTATFANNGEKKNTVTKSEIILTAEEVTLEAELAEEFEVSVADVLAEVTSEATITAVKVFDMEGNEIAAQKGTVDFSKVPAGAELLMTEGSTQYYIVAQ